MALWRARIVSFLAGSGLTAIAAFGVLRQDLATSFKGLNDKVKPHDTTSLEMRVSRLEAAIASGPPANTSSE